MQPKALIVEQYLRGRSEQQSTAKGALWPASVPLSRVLPAKAMTLDNAAMIAGLGFNCYKKEKKGDGLDLEPMTRIPLGV